MTLMVKPLQDETFIWIQKHGSQYLNHTRGCVKLDKELNLIQQISPFNILFKALFGDLSWKRKQPIPLLSK